MNKTLIDWWLIMPVILISTIGTMVLWAVAPNLVSNQLLFFLFGFLIFMLIVKTDPQLFFYTHIYIYVISILFLILPLIFGTVTRGATRWIAFGQFRLQPSEICKPFILITLAMIASGPSSYKGYKLLFTGLIPIIIIFIQPDLGTSLVLMTGWLTILLSQFRIKHIALGFFVLLFSLVPVYKYILKDYQKDRILTFINPYHDPLDKGYHVIQSIIATGSGGLFGRGLGRGTQSQLRFLPEFHTDFIFASLSESLGFVGSISVIILYALFYWRIYMISQKVGRPAESLFCLATTAMLAFQTFVNIGMNIGVAPITGITLPLMSYGGSSLLSIFITLGLINRLSVSTGNRISLGLN